MPTRNISLNKHFDPISNVSEVVREALRLLEQREKEDKAKLNRLRASPRKPSINSTEARGLSLDRWMTSMSLSTRSGRKLRKPRRTKRQVRGRFPLLSRSSVVLPDAA